MRPSTARRQTLTEDAPWMGTVPTVDSLTPNMSCNGLLSCTADLHSMRCAKVESEVRRRDRRAVCSNQGHDWEFLTTTTNDLVTVHCPRCGKSYGVVET